MSSLTGNLSGPATAAAYCRTTLWQIVVGSAVGVYFAELLTAAVVHLASEACSKRNKETDDINRRKLFCKDHRPSLQTRIHLECMALVKGANNAGKILLAMYSMCVVASFIVYVFMTYAFSSADPGIAKSLQACHSSSRFTAVHVDFAINVFYGLVFVCRIIASDSKLYFFLSLETIADHLTLIPSFIMYFMDKYMIVFQFARLGGLKFLVNALIYCQILQGEREIRLMKLLLQIIITWLASAGFFQLIESVGNFWTDDSGKLSSSFLEFHVCFYTMLITMSTVGYGDYSPKTVLGKFFIIIFVVLALGLFTSIVPEISEIMTESKKYRRNKIHLLDGRRHVVLAGDFDLPTVETFFNDFYSDGREENKREFLAMLGEKEPSLEMQALLKTRELYVTYLHGNVMSLRDLKRAELKLATATIILTDGLTKVPEDEDLKNIMRVIAIKDYCPNMRIIVQLHLYRSKTYLRNIPDWSATHGDQALCINEMKYGILAQSCLAPGVSTLLGNLLTLRSFRPMKDQEDSWENEYLEGAKFEFYKVKFAPLFHGLTFQQACRVCYDLLEIMLLAVQVTNWGSTDTGGFVENDSRQTIINPGSNMVIDFNTMEAFVIAKDRKEAKSVSHLRLSSEDETESTATAAYFSLQRRSDQRWHNCNNDNAPHQTIRKTSFNQHQPEHGEQEEELQDQVEEWTGSQDDVQQESPVQHVQSVKTFSTPSLSRIDRNSPTQLELKSVTSFQIDRLAVSRQTSESSELNQGLRPEQPSEQNLDSSGYFHWIGNRSAGSVMLNNHKRYKFRNHIVVCIVEKRADVLLNITSFIMPLRASTIPKNKLKDIVFLGNIDLIFSEWSVIQNFPGIYALDGSTLNRANLKAINIEYVDCCIILSPKANSLQENAQADRETVLCTLNIKTMRHPETGRRLGDTIHIVTELNSVGSIEYLDQDDEMEVEEPFMTQAFATGRTVYLSLLGSIATTIYFNEPALNFLRTILTTVDSDDLEFNLNEQGFHFMSVEQTDLLMRPRLDRQTSGLRPNEPHLRSKIQLFSVCEPPLRCLYEIEGASGCQWRDLATRCLDRLESICIGISRLQVAEQGAKNHRFVIAMPPAEMNLSPTDKVYCLTPANFSGMSPQ